LQHPLKLIAADHNPADPNAGGFLMHIAHEQRS
jgi:hypothetical protein